MKAAGKAHKIALLTRKALRGVWRALLVPWNDRDKVDLRRLAQEVRGVGPLVHEAGLWDSAIDRIQRVAGGGVVGLRCQSPFRSNTEKHVRQVPAWVKKNTPELLPGIHAGQSK